MNGVIAATSSDNLQGDMYAVCVVLICIVLLIMLFAWLFGRN